MRTITLGIGLLAAVASTAVAQSEYYGGAAAPAPPEEEQRSALDDMISPVSSPTVNEDPRNVTEIRPIFLYHRIPSDFLLGSGSLQVAALQVRVALHERFSLIATKDGRVWINPSGGDEIDGWANIASGSRDRCCRARSGPPSSAPASDTKPRGAVATSSRAEAAAC